MDGIRWVLILAGWVGIAVWLWGIAWYWCVIWLVPGLVVMVNVVGVAMLPIYWGLNGRAAERDLIDDMLAKRRNEPRGPHEG